MDEPNPPAESAPVAPAPPLADEGGSLADHEARYKDGGRPEPEPEPTRQAQTEPETPPADQPEPDAQKAEGEDEYGPRDSKGKFLPRTPAQRRPASHEATPADVPRIRELTARLRAAEAERDALKARSGGTAVAPEVSTIRQPAASPSPLANDPEPDPAKYDDYSKYVSDNARWHARQEVRQWQAQQAEAERQRATESERQRLTQSWETKKLAARQKYADFDAVALEVETPIRPGSLIDAWIVDPDNETGADLLYFLQQHPDEVARIDHLPTLKQAEALALLSQRFTGTNGRSRAADTGSAPASGSTPPPKPPNPVRTGPVRAGDDPPDPDKSSLADHEKWWAPRSRRGGGSARA